MYQNGNAAGQTIDSLLCEIPAPDLGSQIQNEDNGECLNVDGDGNSLGDYTSVVTRSCDQNTNNQRWRFTSSGQLLHAPSGMMIMTETHEEL